MSATDELTARLAELTERVRQSRIERGLSPDPPKQKRPLPDDMALELLDRMDKFVIVCTEIARLYRAGIFEIIDIDRLATYKKCARLLARAKDSHVKHFGIKVTLMLAFIEKTNEQITEGNDNIANYRMVHYFYKHVVELPRQLSAAKSYQRKGGF